MNGLLPDIESSLTVSNPIWEYRLRLLSVINDVD